jgi:hypothetical protein
VRVFSSGFATAARIFAAAERGDPQPVQTDRRQSEPQQPQMEKTEGVREQAALRLQAAQQQVQSVMAPCTAGSCLENMLRFETVVQWIMTMFNAAE